MENGSISAPLYPPGFEEQIKKQMTHNDSERKESKKRKNHIKRISNKKKKRIRVIGRKKCEALFGRPARRRWCTTEEKAGLNGAEAEIEIWLSRGSNKGRKWTTQGNEIHRYALSVSISCVIAVMVDNADVLFAHCDFLNCDSQIGLWSLATSFHLILTDSMHRRCHADDGMSGETVPVEEAEAMDSSAADADIDAEAAVRIVDGIGSFGAIEFSSLTAKDVLTTEFTSL
ncbi:hypothetical protein Ahy_A07g034983 isoform B [Arachis hypogaea]|uniref:Uncharacterized protein n=1 Tax=Arachis hypogaea TaxID=3818 RepID=A0A445CD81_ARAHY|nr:hypothetical protein Ahy_A07g034983 isoform B [Arachis hypogaea]